MCSSDLDVAAIRAAVEDPGHGALLIFEGVARDNFDGRPVHGLDYEAYAEMALPVMRAIGAEAAERFSSALDLASQPFVLLLLATALLPGVIEEFAFRGVVYRLLGGTRNAVWLQAILFGLAHGSIHRFLPT